MLVTRTTPTAAVSPSFVPIRKLNRPICNLRDLVIGSWRQRPKQRLNNHDGKTTGSCVKVPKLGRKCAYMQLCTVCQSGKISVRPQPWFLSTRGHNVWCFWCCVFVFFCWFFCFFFCLVLC